MKSTILKGLIVTFLGLVICAAIAVVGMPYVPPEADIPVHWGLDGPDRFVKGSELGPYIWGFPILIAVFGVVFSLAPLLEPFRENLVRSRQAYFATWVAMVGLFAFMQAGFVAKATGGIEERHDVMRWALASVCVLLIVVGNYMPKTRPNFLMGIRTPWTLTSPTAWEKTHRVGGPLFMIAGVIGLVCAVMFGGGAAGLALGVILAPSVVGLLVYSWLVWRKSDDRIRPSDFVG